MKIRRLRIIPFMMLPGLASGAGVEVTSENIKGLLEAKNPKVEASRFSVEAAGEREGSLVRSFLPSVELYGAQESFKKGTSPKKSQPAYGAEVGVNLFNGGRDRLENERRALETNKRKFASQKVLSEEVEKARTMYWQIRYLQEKALLLKTTLEVNQRNLNSAQRRIKSGVATNSDRFEFEMKDVDLRRELSEAEVTIATETRLLSVLLGAGGSPLTFSERLTHDHSYEAVLKHNMGDHEFLFKGNEIEAEQLSLSATSSRRVWLPKLDAYAAYHQFNEREEEFANAADRTESVIGLRLSLSLPAGLESAYEATALTKESEAARSIAFYERQEVEAHLEGEMAALKLLHAQVHEAEENIKRSEGYYKITQSEYGRGVKNSPDVLGASEKLFNMQHKRLEIIRDFQVAKAHVLSKIGK